MIWPHQIALSFASSTQRGVPLFPPTCALFLLLWEQCKMFMEGSGRGYLLLKVPLLP